MKNEKQLMAEIALLYYKKGLTQQEIADSLRLTRQTVSKLLTAATDEGIVEITVHNPEREKTEMEAAFEQELHIRAVIADVSRNNDELRKLNTIERAIEPKQQAPERGGDADRRGSQGSGKRVEAASI